MVVVRVSRGNLGELLLIAIIAELPKVCFVVEKSISRRKGNCVIGIGIFASGIFQRKMSKIITNLKESKTNNIKTMERPNTINFYA